MTYAEIITKASKEKKELLEDIAALDKMHDVNKCYAVNFQCEHTSNVSIYSPVSQKIAETTLKLLSQRLAKVTRFLDSLDDVLSSADDAELLVGADLYEETEGA